MAAGLEIRRFNIREANWQADKNTLSNIRRLVFIVEQQVPQEEEWDGRDESAWHWLATDPDDRPIGTARLLPDGQIGRMAVLSEYRGYGVGAAMLEQAVQKASHLGMERVFLNAQTHALAFYENGGFEAEGDEFLEAGIPHRRMIRRLTPLPDDSLKYRDTGSIPDVSLKTFDTAEVTWRDRGKMIRKAREAVLVRELGLPKSMAADETDETAIHWVAEDGDGQVAGAVRMDLEGHIGRLVVVEAHRGQGIGYSLLELAVTKATRFGYTRASLDGLAALAPLYEKAGFQAVGQAWQAQGYEHQRFERYIEASDEDVHPDPRRALAWGNEYSATDVTYTLGEDNQILLLRREEEFARVIVEMARQARRTLKIYSPMLDHKLYDQAALREMCSALARKNRYTSVEILIYDSHRIIKNGHALLGISRKLSSSIAIRIVHPDYRQTNHEYMLADGYGLVYRTDPDLYEGYANFHDVSGNNRLAREFQIAWETSLNDPNLRQLKI